MGDGTGTGGTAAAGPTGADLSGRRGMSGQIPLAAVVIDDAGLVSHWNSGARWLFGHDKADAVGLPAVDLLPVCGALPDPAESTARGSRSFEETAFAGDTSEADGTPGPGAARSAAVPGSGGPVCRTAGSAVPGSVDLRDPAPAAFRDGGVAHRSAGRARLSVPGDRRIDVLWWAYPLAGPETGRLLVLAADAGPLGSGRPDSAVERVVPGFASRGDLSRVGELAGGLHESMPGVSAEESIRIVARVLELGGPVLEFGPYDRVPVSPGPCPDGQAAPAAHNRCTAWPATAAIPLPRDGGTTDVPYREGAGLIGHLRHTDRFDVDDVARAAEREWHGCLDEADGGIAFSCGPPGPGFAPLPLRELQVPCRRPG